MGKGGIVQPYCLTAVVTGERVPVLREREKESKSFELTGGEGRGERETMLPDPLLVGVVVQCAYG